MSDGYDRQNPYFHYVLRGIMVGSSGVGKSSLLQQMVYNTFTPIHDLTIGVEFESTVFRICDKNQDHKDVKLHIWDTAGMETFHAITRIYFRRCCLVFIVYDVGNRDTFEHVSTWMDQVRQECKPHVEIVLVGNKSDSSIRCVSYQEGLECAKKYGVVFMETSARTGENVRLTFKRGCERIVQYTVEQVECVADNGIVLGALIEPVEYYRSQQLQVMRNDRMNELMNKCCNIS
jgi:Ras-related protein Rab-2A